MLSFGKKKKPVPAPQPPAPKTAEEIAARARFERATSGTFFRTLPYIQPTARHATREWLEVRFDPVEDGWTIRECYEVPRENQTELPIRYKVRTTGCEFLEAVEILADYEDIQSNTGFLTAPAPDAATLGVDYFRNFAVKEGIVFDFNTGLPHPTTIDGDIVADGVFTPADQAAARAVAAAFKQKREAQNVILNAELIRLSPQIPFNAVAGNVMPVNPRAADIANLFSHFETLAAFAEAARTQGWQKKDRPHNYPMIQQIAYLEVLEKRFSNFVQSIDRVFGAEDRNKLKDDLCKTYVRMHFYTMIAARRWVVENMDKNFSRGHDKDWQVTANDLARLNGKCSDAMRHLGYAISVDSALFEQIANAGTSRNTPVEINDILKWTRAVCAGIAKAADPAHFKSEDSAPQALPAALAKQMQKPPQTPAPG